MRRGKYNIDTAEKIIRDTKESEYKNSKKDCKKLKKIIHDLPNTDVARKAQNLLDKIENKKHDKKILHIIVVIAFIGMIVLNAIPITVYVFEIKQLAKDEQKSSIVNKISFESVAENTLMSTGLSIIGLAISVWAGLNILNAISRKEVDELKQKTDELQYKDKELRELYNNIEDINKNEFLKELLETGNDVMSKYFYKQFYSIKCPPDILYKLVLIEKLFSQIHYAHTYENAYSDYLEETTMKIEKQIEDTENYIYNNTENQFSQLNDVINYLKFRKAEGLFYKGYILDSKSSIYKVYYKAIYMYEEIAEKFISNFSELIREEKDDKIDCKDYELFSYYANTIGESYSKILQKCPDDKKMEIDDIGEKAIHYCKLAIKYTKNNAREVYYRNLGCAYERLEKAKEQSFKLYSEEILENYDQAFKLTINKPQMSRKQMGKVYHTYLSYLNGYIQNELEIDLPEEINIYNILNKLNGKAYKNHNIIECIDKIYEVVSVAIVDDIRKTLNVIMYGFANGYVVLKQIKDRNINQMSNCNINDYLEKMKWSIDTLKLMGIYDEDNKYAEQLKSFNTKLIEYVK